MIRTQVYIPDALYHRAKLNAQMHGISISEILRQGLEMGLDFEPKISTKTPLSSLAGAFSVKKYGLKPANAAMTHNDIYDHVLPKKPRRPSSGKRKK